MAESDPESVVAGCLTDLANNAPAEAVLARLRAIEAETLAAPALRARFLRARAIAGNRLGFPDEALGDLLEAKNTLDRQPDRDELARIISTIALVHSWRGEGREAALALLQAVAVAGPENAQLASILAEGGRLHMEIGRPQDALLLFRAALGLAPPGPASRERERAGVNLVPEGRRLFPRLTVSDNLRLGAYSRRGEADRFAPLDLVLTLFPRLGERLGQRAETLSGGEQQMLAIGRGLMTKPRLLMLDEPSQGIAPRLVDDILAAIARIRGLGVTILLVEQRLMESLQIADRAYVLQSGRLVMSGPAAEIAKDDAIRRAYLGI